MKARHHCFTSPQNWLCGTFPASWASAVWVTTESDLPLECKARWLCSNTHFNRSLSRVHMNEAMPNNVSLNSYSTCSLGHAAVLWGAGLESRDTAWCQDNQQSTIIKTCSTHQGRMDDSPTDNFNSTDKLASASLSHTTSGSNYPLPPQGYCSFVFFPFSKLCHLTSNPLTFFITARKLATSKTLILAFSVAFGHPNRTRPMVPCGVALWKALRESSPDSHP